GQQHGGAGHRIQYGVDLVRFEVPKLSGPGDEPAHPFLERGLCLQAGGARRDRQTLADHSTLPACIPSAANRVLVSLRLPMTVEVGAGDILVRLGVSRMPAAAARCGCSQTSTISSSYRSFRCLRQMDSRLAMA